MKKRLLISLFILVLAVTLTACQLPASTPPVTATETTEGGFPLPDTETDPMAGLELMGTQTAEAAMAQNQPTATTEPPAAEPTATSEPVQAEATTAPVESGSGGTGTVATVTVPATYTLQKGEYPYCIARRFDVNPFTLLSNNNLTINSETYPGQSLKIPTGSDFPGTRSLISHPADYTVRTGDTIYTIACKYGDVDPMAIATANNLSAPYTLTAGAVIRIP